MAPRLTEDEIDDLNFLARVADNEELDQLLLTLASREKVSAAEILNIAKDESKATCLHKAAGNGHLETVRAIITHLDSRSAEERRAFIDWGNEFGNTGLHWAAMGGHLDTVKLLLEKGASPALANHRNYVPLDLASLNDRTEVVDFLLSTASGLEDSNEEGLRTATEGLDLKTNDDAEDGVKPVAEGKQ